jgi:hypothetical protein
LSKAPLSPDEEHLLREALCLRPNEAPMRCLALHLRNYNVIPPGHALHAAALALKARAALRRAEFSNVFYVTEAGLGLLQQTHSFNKASTHL